MTGLIGGIAPRKVFPRRSGSQDPENAVEHIPRNAPAPDAAIASHPRHEKQSDPHLPLVVDQVSTHLHNGSDRRLTYTPNATYVMPVFVRYTFEIDF